MNDRIVGFIKYHPIRTQRGLEILTGLIPWSIILFPLIGSFFIPETVAYFVLAFNTYWLYRSLQLAVFATSGYLNIKATEKENWIQRLNADPKTKGRWRKIRHVVLVCNVKEPITILRRILDSLVAQNLPRKQLLVVLAMEEREKEAPEKTKILAREYKNKFGALLTTYHPLAPGETIGKHSNETYAARKVKKFLVDQQKIPIENLTLTSADADSVFAPQYFSLLTYKFLSTPHRFHQFFQAPLFRHNNLHRVPIPSRILEIISGVVFLAGLQKYSKRFFVVSTYSTSLKLIDKVGYWDPDVIPEDWHIHLKSYFALEGRVELVPLYLPVTIDAAESTTLWRTLINRYQQTMRQAWGATDIPYVVKQFFLHPEISFWNKLNKISFVLESHFVWSTQWFFLTLGANIPAFLNQSFARTTLGFNLSRISSTILTLCLIGLLAVIFIDILLDPKKQRKIVSLLSPVTYLQWLFLPIASLFLSALPGLESQTRLMLGKYIEYRVTEKV